MRAAIYTGPSVNMWKVRIQRQQQCLSKTEWDALVEHAYHHNKNPNYHSTVSNDIVVVHKLQVLGKAQSVLHEVYQHMVATPLIKGAIASSLLVYIIDHGVHIQYNTPATSPQHCCLSHRETKHALMCRVLQTNHVYSPVYYVHKSFKPLLDAWLVVARYHDFIAQTLRQQLDNSTLEGCLNDPAIKNLRIAIQHAISIVYFSWFYT